MQKTNYLSWQGHKNQVCRMRQEKKFSTFAYVIPLEFSIGWCFRSGHHGFKQAGQIHSD
jgi:hypothetical protein